MQNLARVLVSQSLALTVSPKPIVGDYLEKYHTEFLPIIVRFLRRCSKRYIMYPEFTDTGRLHFHGLVDVIDKVAFCKGIPLLQRLGFVKIDKIRTLGDRLRWIIYISKDRATLGALNIKEPIYPRKPIRSRKKLETLQLSTNLTRFLVEKQ